MNPDRKIIFASLTPAAKNRKQFYYHLFILFFFVSLLTFDFSYVYSQPTQQWASRYQRTSNSPAFANFLAIDKLGNSYVCGTVFDTGTRNDMILIKYNSTGDTLWTRRYNNNNNEDLPCGVVSDSLGNVYVSLASGPGGNLNDFITLKYSPSGVLLWTRVYGYSGMDEAPKDIKMDKQGKIYIVGTNATASSSIIIKYDINGDSLWVRLKTEANYLYYGVALGFDASNNVYMAIFKTNNNTGLDAFLVTKYDSNGNEQWTGTHNNNAGFDGLVSLAIDNEGNSYISGRHSSSFYITLMFNPTGTEQWTSIYNNGNGNVAYAIVTDNNGNCYVTGASQGESSNYDYLTIKYNSNGDSLWVRRYNGPGNDDDGAYAIAVDDSTNIYVTGASIGTGTGYDYATVKYNASGMQQWVVRYNSNPPNGEDDSYSILLDSQRNIYISGISDRGGFVWDYVTIKYSQTPVGILPISNNIPTYYKLYQNYPNPFNPQTNIDYQIIKNSYVELIVYNVLGNEIEKLVSENQKPGAYRVNWNANNYASGIYFYKLITESYTETKKMILLK